MEMRAKSKKYSTMARERLVTLRESNSESSSTSIKIPNVEPKLVSTILDEMIEKKPTVKFNDIGGQNRAKRALEETVILPVVRPEVK